MTLHHKQQVIVESIQDYHMTFVTAGHATGKTTVARHVIDNWKGHVLCNAPTDRQFDILVDGVDRLKFTRLSADMSEAMRYLHGTQNNLIVFDEAAGVDPDVWEMLMPLLNGRGSRFLAIGTPPLVEEGLNPFLNAWESNIGNNIRVSCEDVAGQDGLVTREWIEDKKYRWGDTSKTYLRRVLGLIV